jgi:predicted Zn-dependent protease
MITHRYRRGSAIYLLVLGTLVAGCASDSRVIGQANQFHSGLERAVYQDRELDEYLQQVGARIIAGARQYDPQLAKDGGNAWMFSKDMRFHLVNSKALNAFTTGGEHMYIYNELFQTARSEDELTAVMAHEFAHVYGRHVHKGMNRQMGILGLAGLAGAAGYAAGGSEKGKEYAGMSAGAALLAGQFVGMSYTRGDEAQADSLGFDFYVQAGWDPAHFGDFFQQLVDKGYDKGPDYLSDHPSLSSRVAAAKQRAAKLPPEAKSWRKSPVADPARFKQLQARAQRIAQSMPSEESLQKTQELLAALPRSCLTPAIQQDQIDAEVRVAENVKASKQEMKAEKKREKK